MKGMEHPPMVGSRPYSLPALDNGSGAAPVIVQYPKAMKDRNPITAVLLAALVLPLGLIASHEASGTLHLDGILLLRGDRSSMGRVVITPLDAPEQVMENVEGHFTLDLLLERTYMLSFERRGMVTKRVYFDTNVPAEESARRFEFPFQVTLFTEGANGVGAYAGPVGYVYYLTEVGDFVHRAEYKVAPGTPEEKRMSDLLARVSLPEVRVPPAHTAVIADLKWMKHGKRGQLFIGKVHAPDGRLIAEGQFLDARLQEMHGAFVFYHGNGQVESKGRFEHGRKSGVWQRFDPAGRPLAERIYDPEAMERMDRTVAANVASNAPASDHDRILTVSAASAERTTISKAATVNANTGHAVAARTFPSVLAKPVASNTGKAANKVAGSASVACDTRDAGTAGLGRSEELIVERLRVITVMRLQGATGHTTEYRRVADRYGSVMYFEDGRNIPASIYHARTGR
jgi:hypothetical protein